MLTAEDTSKGQWKDGLSPKRPLCFNPVQAGINSRGNIYNTPIDLSRNPILVLTISITSLAVAEGWNSTA